MVIGAERRRGFQPRDISAENRGYDIESYDTDTGHLSLIEVKGRASGSDTITVTCNEILTARNDAENLYLGSGMHPHARPVA